MRSYKHKGHYGHEGRRMERTKEIPLWNFVLFVVKELGLPR